MGYNSVADIRSIFILLDVVVYQNREIMRNSEKKFDLTTVQGHPRSSILVSMESPCTTFY